MNQKPSPVEHRACDNGAVTWPLLLVIVGIAGLAYGIHRLALWAENRGLIYYRHRPAGHRGFGQINRIFTLYDPSLDHIVEERIAGDYRHVDDEDGQAGPDDNGASP